MRHLIKKLLCTLLLASGLQTVFGYALLGPAIGGGQAGDSWEVPTIGYGLNGDIGTPKNLGEEYRWNVSTLYYSYNQTFLDFFGSSGVTAIDQAFAIVNTVTNVNSYSSELNEFPLQSQNINYQAQALGLLDLKSIALSLLMEQMGLAEPERYVWTLRQRYTLPGGTCPADEVYGVIQRNYDYATSPLNQLQYSSYVNATLFTYFIVEACTGQPPLALAEPVPVDPLAEPITSVASLGITLGGYYFNLTRDDVAGLRYLWNTNNVNTESPSFGSLLNTSTTNFTTQVLFPANTNGAYGGYGTYNLSTLLLASSTNDPATLVTLFPGLVVASSSNYVYNATGYTTTYYFTNPPGSPIGSPPELVTKLVPYNYPVIIYVNTFANVVTNHYYSTTTATSQTISVGRLNGAPVGSPLVTNTTTTVITLKMPGGANLPGGDYYLLPTNLCGVDITSQINKTTITTTNILASASTNFNGTNLFALQQTVSSYNSYTYLMHPVTCTQTANATNLYQGIGNIKFVKANYDSLIGQFFQPITNKYTMVAVINSQARVQNFERVVTVPDISFGAADLVGADFINAAARAVNFNTANIYSGLAGPGTIDPANQPIVFNKSTPIYQNQIDGSEFTQVKVLAWGSFDSSTNDPIVYPNGTSIADLENQILVQVSPPTLPNGTKNVAYPPTTFTATGGSFSPPFTWTLATGLGALPPGLSLSSGGTISGTPTHSGIYDFVIQLNDSLIPPRTVQWNYSITIP